MDYPSDYYMTRCCEECLSYGYHEKKCSKYVDRVREENKRNIREDIDADFDSDDIE